ncbi:MAG: hypothetical protein CMJ94_08845 [Planctomycetes bacterium]|nr:hypothetical protein [Planctomycetota bacterium]
MLKKFFPAVGIFAVLAWTALGLFAWSQVKTKLRVVIQEEGAEANQEVALLEDRLNTLSADLDTLVEALGSNFQLLATALAEEGDRAAVDAARTGERLAALERAMPAALAAREAVGALQSSLRQVEALAGQLRQGVQPAETTVTTALLTETEPIDVQIPEPAPEPEVIPGPEPEAPAQPPARKSFLAFSLPDRDFHFEGEQSFEILSDLSRVGFDAKTTLHDFTGISEKVQGKFTVDLAHPEQGVEGELQVRADSLITGLEGRDEAMLEHLEAEQHPEIRFVLTGFRAPQVDAAKKSVAGTLTGRMTIRGKTVDVELPVSAQVDDARRLVIEGEMPLSLPDYEVPVPNKLGVITMEEEVRVWVRLRARVRAEEAN